MEAADRRDLVQTDEDEGDGLDRAVVVLQRGEHTAEAVGQSIKWSGSSCS